MTKNYKVILRNKPGSWPDWSWSVNVTAESPVAAEEIAIAKMAKTMFPRTEFVAQAVQQPDDSGDALD